MIRKRPTIWLTALLWIAASGTLFVGPSTAVAKPNPPLKAPTAKLRAAVHCSAGTENRRTVVLVHGTAMSVEEAWSWGYQRALPRAGFAVCTVELPGKALVSMYRSTEYVVHAIRVARRRSGRRVTVIGHSQGGSHPLWSMAFWPSVRKAVKEYIGLAPGVNGTLAGNLACAAGSCAPLSWQVRFGSNFLNAFHRRGIPHRPDYTVAYTQMDEVAFPQPDASHIAGGSNIAVQSICPGRAVEHLHMLGDNVAWAIALDALTHRGPADPARIDPSACESLFVPGTDVGRMLASYAATAARFASFLATGPKVAEEPRVPRYAR